MSYVTRPEADLHVHTIASGHAYSTIGEIAREAGNRGITLVGMTDHGPALPGGPHAYHFAALRFVPETLHGVRILKGVEANILPGARLDLNDGYLNRLDLVMAGFHEHCGFDDGGEEVYTQTLLELMQDPRVKVITHPGNPNFPLDYEVVAEMAARTGTALEINNSSFGLSRRGSEDNCRKLVAQCLRFGTPVSVSSDAHIAQGVGEFENSLAVLQEAGIPWDQIVNRTMASTLEFLGLDK